MSNDPNQTDEETPESDHPDNWDRDEMRTNPRTAPDDEEKKVPTWNEGQMGEQSADGSRTPGPSDEEIAESAGGLSGGGTNPGGGERWAERDDEPAED